MLCHIATLQHLCFHHILCKDSRNVPSQNIWMWNGDIAMVASDGDMAKSSMVVSHSGRTKGHHLLVTIIVGLVEEEVGGQLLVLVARKVGLDDKIALEAKATQALDSFTLLLGDGDGLGAGWQRRVLVSILGEQL